MSFFFFFLSSARPFFFFVVAFVVFCEAKKANSAQRVLGRNEQVYFTSEPTSFRRGLRAGNFHPAVLALVTFGGQNILTPRAVLGLRATWALPKPEAPFTRAQKAPAVQITHPPPEEHSGATRKAPSMKAPAASLFYLSSARPFFFRLLFMLLLEARQESTAHSAF